MKGGNHQIIRMLCYRINGIRYSSLSLSTPLY
ncbi:hypothetical protein Ocin01_11659 [Orchesella cincta]|uniref:Uncharacterized protein n=1 Tax=Orchesella cincta TaxID=48709 RepID=A0A1D2MQ46_ORCCI|nr:hypothetical protein Ocin01_11659 [Orchesella cincta]